MRHRLGAGRLPAPTRPAITLAVSRAPALDASDPGGHLVFNPGGPGESGNQILPVVLDLFPAAIRQRVRRGELRPAGNRGQRSPAVRHLALGADQRRSRSPRRPASHCPGTPVFTAMARACQHGQAAEPFINTVNTARDMDRIRQALGLSTISFYGMSYGTVLGAVYADLFPHRVATMVLDGAVDVNATLTQQAEEEAPAAEQSLHHLFATCLAQAPCPLGTDPQAFFSDAGHVADATTRCRRPGPATPTRSPGAIWTRPPCSRSACPSSPGRTTRRWSPPSTATGPRSGPWPSSFATDINGAPLVDPLWAITCNDAAVHPGPVAAGTLARTLNARYPLIGAYAVTYTMGGCVAWPAARQPVVDLHPAGTPPDPGHRQHRRPQHPDHRGHATWPPSSPRPAWSPGRGGATPGCSVALPTPACSSW